MRTAPWELSWIFLSWNRFSDSRTAQEAGPPRSRTRGRRRDHLMTQPRMQIEVECGVLDGLSTFTAPVCLGPRIDYLQGQPAPTQSGTAHLAFMLVEENPQQVFSSAPQRRWVEGSRILMEMFECTWHARPDSSCMNRQRRRSSPTYDGTAEK